MASSSKASSRNKLVLSVGQVCVDYITVCEKYPDEDDQVCAESQYWQRGGNAGNFATVLSILGTPTEFLGTVSDVKKISSNSNILGNAAKIRYCLAEFDRYGVKYDHLALRDCNDFPSTSIILSKATGSRTIAHYRGILDELTIKDFSVLDLGEYSWIHFEGRCNVEVMKEEIEIIQKHNEGKDEENKVKVSVELELPQNSKLSCLCSLADMVIISRYFAELTESKSALDCVNHYRNKLKPGGEVVCTWGEHGAAFAKNIAGDVAENVPAVKPTVVFDTTGAGDTFQAALIHAKLNKLSLGDSVRFACEVASKKISGPGFDTIEGMGLTG